MSDEGVLNAVELATELTIAWLANQNNRVSADDVPSFLRRMHATVLQLAESGGDRAFKNGESEARTYAEFKPAVSVRKSLASRDYIISMIDGKPYKALRRHLAANGLSAEEYRARYNLKADYPMVAPAYSEARRAMAHRLGLGAKGRQSKAAPVGTDAVKSARKPRTKVLAEV